MKGGRVERYCLVFISMVLLVGVLYWFQNILKPFVVAVILSFLFVPLRRANSNKKWVAAGLISLILVAGTLGSALLIYAATQEAVAATTDVGNSESLLETRLAELQESTNDLLGTEVSLSELLSLDKVMTVLKEGIGSALSGLSKVASNGFLVLLFLIFLIPGASGTFSTLEKSMSKSNARKFRKALFDIEDSIYNYLKGKTLISAVSASASGLVLVLFGAKYPVLFALLFFFLNFIPNFGSFVAMFATIMSNGLLDGFSLGLLGLLAALIAVEMFFGNYLEPKISGKDLKLSPVIILLSLLFWGSIWGIAGMVLSVPLTAILKVILETMPKGKQVSRLAR
jgi:AI-2 transport protein TqsA